MSALDYFKPSHESCYVQCILNGISGYEHYTIKKLFNSCYIFYIKKWFSNRHSNVWVL